MLDFDTTRLVAQVEERTHFEHFCAVHGHALFLTETAECFSCLSDQLANLSSADFTARKARRKNKPDNPVRTAARLAGERTYPDNCPVHGETHFHVGTGRCFTCYTAGGQVRRGNRDAARSDGARAVARRRGERVFAASCPVHGPKTAHSVAHGKCLKCFNVVGAKRKRPWTEGPRYIGD